MKNQLSTVTEVVVRSTFYIITNYVSITLPGLNSEILYCGNGKFPLTI